MPEPFRYTVHLQTYQVISNVVPSRIDWLHCWLLHIFILLYPPPPPPIILSCFSLNSLPSVLSTNHPSLPFKYTPSHPSLFSFSLSFSLFHVPSYDYVTSGRLPIHCTPQLEGSPPHTQTSDGLLSSSWRLCMLPSANQKAPERQGERVSMCVGLAVGACPWVWLWYQSW